MQKNFIFIVCSLALLIGGVGGVLGSYWFSYAGKAFLQESSSSSSFTWVEAQKRVAPAVVSILSELPNNKAGGTGFLIDPSGLVLTNKHVLGSDDDYVAVMQDGTQFDFEIEAIDPAQDIALIRLIPVSDEEGSLMSFPFVKLGNSSVLEVGDPVLAIGNALAEYENTTTAGIISAKGRKLVASGTQGNPEHFYGLLQTDAAINLGNSGGPLVNSKGEVIGINTAVDADAQGIGFAIPIDDVKPALESWRKYGEILRPMLGVQYIILTEPKARELDLEVMSGALIAPSPLSNEPVVIPGSAAEQAGLQEGDVIVEVDGTSITLDYTLHHALLKKQIEEVVLLKVFREGAFFETSVELTKWVSNE